MRVDDRRRSEFDASALDGDIPALKVDLVVVRYSRQQLCIAVSPPSAQCRRWWASHSPGGRSQPGKLHPPSRATNARRMRNGAHGPADVEGLGVTAEHDRDQLAIAGKAAGCGRAD